MFLSSMVINYLYIFRACVCPSKADAPSIVYTDAVLTKTTHPRELKQIDLFFQHIARSRDL